MFAVFQGSPDSGGDHDGVYTLSNDRQRLSHHSTDGIVNLAAEFLEAQAYHEQRLALSKSDSVTPSLEGTASEDVPRDGHSRQSSLDLSISTDSRGLDEDSSIWEQESLYTDRSETASIATPRSNHSGQGSTKGARGRTSVSSTGESKGIRAVKSKKRRNRYVDINDIVIEFDPKKEFLWEMRLKYERDKRKRLNKQSASLSASLERLDTVSDDIDPELSPDPLSQSLPWNLHQQQRGSETRSRSVADIRDSIGDPYSQVSGDWTSPAPKESSLPRGVKVRVVPDLVLTESDYKLATSQSAPKGAFSIEQGSVILRPHQDQLTGIQRDLDSEKTYTKRPHSYPLDLPRPKLGLVPGQRASDGGLVAYSELLRQDFHQDFSGETNRVSEFSTFKPSDDSDTIRADAGIGVIDKPENTDKPHHDLYNSNKFITSEGANTAESTSVVPAITVSPKTSHASKPAAEADRSKSSTKQPDDMRDITEKTEQVNTEVLVIHRLPGEKLGMGLSIESVGGDDDPIKGVFVENIVPGGAADKATGGTQGICVGDEILAINGTPLKDVSYSETVAFFREMPLRMILMVSRKVEPKVILADVELGETTTDLPEEQFEIPEGFETVAVSLEKKPTESLGISIVPSYGSTQKFYQVSLTISTFSLLRILITRCCFAAIKPLIMLLPVSMVVASLSLTLLADLPSAHLQSDIITYKRK